MLDFYTILVFGKKTALICKTKRVFTMYRSSIIKCLNDRAIIRKDCYLAVIKVVGKLL
jgi:hypothetical protein